MNKEIIKKIEGNIFPRKFIFPNNTSIKEEEESIIHEKDNNLDTNDLIDVDEF